MKVLEFIFSLIKSLLLIAVIGFITFCVLMVITFIMPQNVQTALEILTNFFGGGSV